MDPKHYFRIFIYVSVLLGLISPLSRAQTPTKNYVISRTYREANAQVALPSSSVYWGNSRQAVSQINYFDGLGKQKQQVSVYGSNQATKDLFQQTDYDALHRPEKHYLPVAVTPGTAGEYATLSSSFYASGDVLKSPNSSANYFTQTVYEPSPLSRTAQVKAPALHNDSSGVQTFYKVSDNTIKRYTAGTGLMDITSSSYSAGELQYTEVVDEYRRMLREYTDHQGRTVLKRIVLGATSFLDTYYVYNAIGQLRAVLQPEFQTSNSIAYAFYYLYDARGNMTEKKIPGAVSTTMTYDSRDRLKSMTDGKGQVFSYEYEDNLNRLKRTKLANDVISENYYDQYPQNLGLTFNDTLFKEWKNSPATYLLKGTSTDQVQGMLTASDQYLFNASGSRQGSFLRTLYYYDKKGRLIQTVRQLYGLGNNAIERVSYLLDFTGKVLRERTDQSVNSSTIHLEKGFAYDHMDRLVKVMHRVWTGTKAPKQYTHSELVYDEIGQLKTKKLHGGLQTLTYKNHVRGWMGSIQQSQGKTFSLNLEYLSNGNIKTMAWGADNSSGSMALAYDAASRLTSATGVGGFNGFNENLAYDKNGNISTLKRHENSTLIDNLTYSYAGNKLVQVEEDASNNPAGFTNGASSGDEMGYDANGNLTKDDNRGITLTYNPLNLIAQAKKGTNTLSYVYNAAGSKLQLMSPNTTTTYAGAFEYDGSGNLKRIAIEEGQLVMASDSFRVEYFLRDHLGNVRMVVGENNQVKQVTDYHAFGKAVDRAGNKNSNPYRYNGKEEQDETGFLDYGARQYDVTLGRWMSIDPLADKYYSLSPYNYVSNTPINAIDPEGKLIIFVNGHWNSALNSLGMAPGAPQEKYWRYFDSKFVSSVAGFFNDRKTAFVDGSSHFGGDQSGGDRFRNGVNWAKKNYEKVIGSLADGETIKLVGHSEGSAYAAGIADYFIKRAIKDGRESLIQSILHLAPDEADEFDNPKEPTTYRITDVLDLVSPAGYYLSGVDYEMTTGGYRDVNISDVLQAHGRPVTSEAIYSLMNALSQFIQNPNVKVITTSDGSSVYRRVDQ